MLKFLFGVFIGYLIANIQIARYLVVKGYRSIYDVPDKD